MRKQITKKLVLHKETLRELTESHLGRIAGGAGPSQFVEDSCEFTCFCQTTK
jgi:hypothetical protein